MRGGYNSRTKLAYSNVVASVALFVSLGGVSYAAVTLPAHSVGKRQLKPGAVSPGALSFPLGVAGTTFTRSDDLSKGACNSGVGRGPGIAVPPCMPGSATYTGGREVHLDLRSPGRLFVSAVAGLKNEGQPETHAHVTLAVVVDRHLILRTASSCAGGQSLQVPIQALVNVGAGIHTAGLAIEASYDSATPGDVVVAPVSIVAGALPPA
jgi:hypothetical protein